MKKVSFECTERDIVYILNCISITKKLFKNGRCELYNSYFKEDMINSYMYDLTIMQKLIGYKANRVLYNYNDNDFFIGQSDYLNLCDKDFNHLFGKERKQRLKEIKKEVKYRNRLSIDVKIKKGGDYNMLRNFWLIQKRR